MDMYGCNVIRLVSFIEIPIWRDACPGAEQWLLPAPSLPDSDEARLIERSAEFLTTFEEEVYRRTTADMEAFSLTPPAPPVADVEEAEQHE